MLEGAKALARMGSTVELLAAGPGTPQTENNLNVTVHRLRHRYGEVLREEMARTGATPEQVEEEIQDLFAALG